MLLCYCVTLILLYDYCVPTPTPDTLVFTGISKYPANSSYDASCSLFWQNIDYHRPLWSSDSHNTGRRNNPLEWRTNFLLLSSWDLYKAGCIYRHCVPLLLNTSMIKSKQKVRGGRWEVRGLQKLLETLQLILGLGSVQSGLICDIDCFVYIKLRIFILKLYWLYQHTHHDKWVFLGRDISGLRYIEVKSADILFTFNSTNVFYLFLPAYISRDRRCSKYRGEDRGRCDCTWSSSWSGAAVRRIFWSDYQHQDLLPPASSPPSDPAER